MTIGEPVVEGSDILLNATPVGMLTDARMPIRENGLPAPLFVFDAIVKPQETPPLTLAICTSTPGMPRQQFQMLGSVFSACVWGAWSVAIMSMTPSFIACHSASAWPSSRIGGFMRTIPPQRSTSRLSMRR